MSSGNTGDRAKRFGYEDDEWKDSMILDKPELSKKKIKKIKKNIAKP